MTDMLAINIEALGMIPAWIDPNQEDPLWYQVHENYAHGGGWRDYDGFTVERGSGGRRYVLSHAGDPDMREIARLQTASEVLVMFPYSWVLWQNLDDGETKIARID